jgi:hypothetical protein
MSDAWITLSELFDELRRYLRHLEGCDIFLGGRCDCGLLRKEVHMEDVIHNLAKEHAR